MKAFSHSMRMINNFQNIKPLVAYAPKRPFSLYKVNFTSLQTNLLLLSFKTPYSLTLFDLNKALIGGEVEGSLKGKDNSESDDDMM